MTWSIQIRANLTPVTCMALQIKTFFDGLPLLTASRDKSLECMSHHCCSQGCQFSYGARSKHSMSSKIQMRIMVSNKILRQKASANTETTVFGRSPMTSSLAWQLHGCYKVGSNLYNDFPIDSALHGCSDDSVSLDHRDPTHPVRGIVKTMNEMRENYPVLNDGFYLEQLSNLTHDIYLPGSGSTPTETGLWSIVRSRSVATQDFTGKGQGNQSVWLVYHNDNKTVNYQFNCSDEQQALVSPFNAGMTVKNLFPPFEEHNLQSSVHRLGYGVTIMIDIIINKEAELLLTLS